MTALLAAAALLAATASVGAAASRRQAGPALSLLLWANAIAGMGSVPWLLADEPAGFRLIVAMLAGVAGLKGVALAHARFEDRPTGLRLLAFYTLWPGMHPSEFARPRAVPGNAAWLIATGSGQALFGVALTLSAGPFFRFASEAARPWGTAGEVAAVTATALLQLVGVGFTLNFGLLRALAGVLRGFGTAVRPLFVFPLRSANLEEFWGRRWNLAFADLAAAAIQRPLQGRMGADNANFVGFVVSGLLHELATSAIAGAGWGLPTLYFVIHGLLVRWERRRRQAGADVRRPIDRIRMVAATLLPLPLLFHPPFLAAALWPAAGIVPFGG